MRSAVLALTLTLALAARAAASPSYDLVSPRTCLAGSWGESNRHEWHVQLGVFDDERAAARLVRAAAARGLATETYVAAWLAGDREPTVVVSPAFRSRAAAARAARRYRAAAADAFARDFVVWSH